MVEILRGFPAFHVVAFGALVPQLPLVRIAVAALAHRRKPEIRLCQIFVFDQLAVSSHHVRRRVALLASEGRMLSFQVVSRQPMVELFLRRLPVNQVEILPVVLQVAAYAIFSIGIAHLQPGVIPMPPGKCVRHFLVAFQAFECRRAGAKGMARVALRCTAKRRVRLRKRPGRNLPEGSGRREQARRGEDQQQRCRPSQPGNRLTIHLRAGRAFPHASLRLVSLNCPNLHRLPALSMHQRPIQYRYQVGGVLRKLYGGPVEVGY